MPVGEAERRKKQKPTQKIKRTLVSTDLAHDVCRGYPGSRFLVTAFAVRTPPHHASPTVPSTLPASACQRGTPAQKRIAESRRFCPIAPCEHAVKSAGARTSTSRVPGAASYRCSGFSAVSSPVRWRLSRGCLGHLDPRAAKLAVSRLKCFTTQPCFNWRGRGEGGVLVCYVFNWGGGGGGVYLVAACLDHLTIDHASLSRWSTVATPNRDTSNICALNTCCLYTSYKKKMLILSPSYLTFGCSGSCPERHWERSYCYGSESPRKWRAHTRRDSTYDHGLSRRWDAKVTFKNKNNKKCSVHSKRDCFCPSQIYPLLNVKKLPPQLK